MTPAERAAVHALAGAFGRLSLAAELVVQAKPGPARAALVERMEAARKLALSEFAAAQDALAAPEMSSEAPKAPPQPLVVAPSPPPRLAAQTPAPSTTKPVAPGAGSGRAVSALPLTTMASVALEMVARGPIYAGQLAERTGKSVESCRTTLWQLQKQGLLTYTRPPAGRARRESGTYAAAVPIEQLVLPEKPLKRRPSTEPRLARTALPAGDEVAELARYGVRRLAPEQAAKSEPRAQVPGVHRSASEFFAAKEPLPAHRPPVLPECGGGRRV